MKKILAVLMLVVTTCLLCGCITMQRQFEPYATMEELESVEIFYFETSLDGYTLEIDKYHPIMVLEQDLHANVFDELQNLIFEDNIVLFVPSDPNFDIMGFAIKLQFEDGTFQLVSRACTYTFASNKNHPTTTFGHVDDAVWKQLIVDFVGQEQWDQYVVED